jgi:hypothetical protein
MVTDGHFEVLSCLHTLGLLWISRDSKMTTFLGERERIVTFSRNGKQTESRESCA